jgi:hypothetical protein
VAPAGLFMPFGNRVAVADILVTLLDLSYYLLIFPWVLLG